MDNKKINDTVHPMFISVNLIGRMAKVARLRFTEILFEVYYKIRPFTTSPLARFR